MATRKTKQPRELLDFDFSGMRALGDEDAIVDVIAFFTGPDQALVIENISWTDIVAKLWISGGTDGAIYKVTVIIMTVAGRKIEGEFILAVKDK